jgi:hypothetical protein
MGINVDNSFELFEWKPIYVNVNNIFEIYINKSGTTHISTFNAEFGVTCRETPEEVIELINKGQ